MAVVCACGTVGRGKRRGRGERVRGARPSIGAACGCAQSAGRCCIDAAQAGARKAWWVPVGFASLEITENRPRRGAGGREVHAVAQWRCFRVGPASSSPKASAQREITVWSRAALLSRSPLLAGLESVGLCALRRWPDARAAMLARKREPRDAGSRVPPTRCRGNRAGQKSGALTPPHRRGALPLHDAKPRGNGSVRWLALGMRCCVQR